MPSGLRQVYDMVPTKSRNVRGRRMRARTQCPATCHACGQERGQVSRGVETTRGAAGPPFSWGSAAPSRAIACPPPRARQSILRLTGVCLCLCLRRQRARFTGTRASRARGTRATTPTPRPGRTAHMHASRSRTSRTATRPALWAWLSSALAPPPTAPPVREAPPRPAPGRADSRACASPHSRLPGRLLPQYALPLLYIYTYDCCCIWLLLYTTSLPRLLRGPPQLCMTAAIHDCCYA